MTKSEHLAINVKGWKLIKSSDKRWYWESIVDGFGPNSFVMWAKDWQPDENIEQAFMCWDTFTLATLEKTANENGDIIYQAYVEHFDNGGCGESFSEDKCRAIVDAICQATGYEE